MNKFKKDQDDDNFKAVERLFCDFEYGKLQNPQSAAILAMLFTCCVFLRSRRSFWPERLAQNMNF